VFEPIRLPDLSQHCRDSPVNGRSISQTIVILVTHSWTPGTYPNRGFVIAMKIIAQFRS